MYKKESYEVIEAIKGIKFTIQTGLAHSCKLDQGKRLYFLINLIPFLLSVVKISEILDPSGLQNLVINSITDRVAKLSWKSPIMHSKCVDR